jgi:hypothetical protein
MRDIGNCEENAVLMVVGGVGRMRAQTSEVGVSHPRRGD